MVARFLPALLCLAAVGCTGPSQPGADRAVGAAPLVERTTLLADAGRLFTRISPDGQWLSWLAPRDGVMNLWIAPVAAPRSRISSSPMKGTDSRDRRTCWPSGR
jgi:hypothetical protein